MTVNNIRQASRRPHVHKEAFCRMKYQTKDGAETEWIWNSRDGVTPLIVHSRSGVEMVHTDWHLDQYMPGYQPQEGERIFVDLTPDIAQRLAQEQVERYWNHPEYPLSERYDNKDDAIASFANQYLDPPGQPWLYPS